MMRAQTMILDLDDRAGQTLRFDIEILGVAPPAKP